jgi:hypothetical protein
MKILGDLSVFKVNYRRFPDFSYLFSNQMSYPLFLPYNMLGHERFY